MTKGTFIKAQDILDATNGGLDIITDLYQDAFKSVDQKNRKFKTRDEKTASSSLRKGEDDTWRVKDFGDGEKAKDGIQCYMQEKSVDFLTALQELAAKYHVISAEQAKEIYKAVYSERPAAADEAEGVWSWEIRDSLLDEEIETVLSKFVLKYVHWKSENPKFQEEAKNAYAKIAAVFKYYHWHPLINYSLVKNRKVMTFSSTPQYPIFLIDEGSHQKIYQPKHPDKGRRFMYYGEKPKTFIHGLAQLNKEYEKRKKLIETKNEDDKENADRENGAVSSGDNKVQEKFARIILGSGGSDVLNMALLNLRTKKGEIALIWKNSETEGLSDFEYNDLSRKTDAIYQLQDIDETGKRSAHKQAMKFLDIYTIELPEDLKRHRDSRGNPCKDVRDYLNYYRRSDLERLIECALPYRFWEQKPRYEGRGDNRIFVGYDYEVDNVQMYNFLQKNGFYRIAVGDKESDWEYIKITGNTVSKSDPVKIRAFIKKFLQERLLDKDLRNAMFRTTQMSESSLSNLDDIRIDFTDFDKHTQFMFFQNKTLQITASEIKVLDPGSVSRFIWEDEVQDHRFELNKEEPFTITKNNLGNYDIQVNNTSCIFLKYLIQTSRVHWRAELEGEELRRKSPADQEKYKSENQFNIAGPILSEDAQQEQKQHLINKLFAIGYMLHRYKTGARPWLVYAMDNRISEDGRSHGGSGKSILFDTAMRRVMKKNFYINGRVPKVMEDPHKYDGLTEHDRYILIEDASEHFNLGILFNDITGEINVNPKGKRPYTIPFDRAPKLAMTTNYTPRNLDSSMIRRMLYYVVSDYYHTAGETNDYNETRDPGTEFGMQIIKDFDRTQMNDFYNTLVYALKFYLGCTEKIGPAMNNVTRRQLLSTMGEGFIDWANAFFSKESGNLDKFIVRQEVFNDYKINVNNKETPQKFKEKLSAFCKLHDYTLNPSRLQNEGKAIIQKVENKKWDDRSGTWYSLGGPKISKEVFYIETVFEVPESFTPTNQTDINISKDACFAKFRMMDPGEELTISPAELREMVEYGKQFIDDGNTDYEFNSTYTVFRRMTF